MKRTRLIGAVIVVLVLAAGGFWYATSRKQAAQSAATQAELESAVVSRQDVIQSISASGTVRLSDQVNVRPLLSGKVKALHVKAGDRVRQGQLLLVLDDQDVRDRLAQAKEALLSAQTRLAKVESDLVIAPTQLEAQLASARATVVAAEVKLKQLKTGAKPEEIDQQRAAVNQARINAESASADHQRYKELFASGVVSRQQFEAAETKYLTAVESQRAAERRLDLLLAPPDANDVAAAEAQLAQAKANLRLAEVNHAAGASTDQVASARSQLVQAQVSYEKAREDLASTRLTAPVAGIVVELSLSQGNKVAVLGVGDEIGPESGLIAIANPSSVEIEAQVDEADISGVRLGQPVLVTADSYEGREFQGTVTTIAPSGANTDGVVTFDVTVSVSEGTALRAGMTADAEIIVARRQNVLVVPKEAVVLRRGRPMVQVAATGDARFKRVEAGLEDDTNVEIVSGLTEGETVFIPRTASNAGGAGEGRNGNGGRPGPGTPGVRVRMFGSH